MDADTGVRQALWAPQWIDRVFPPRGGRDHLGVGSVTSDQILPLLSPGINVLTVHPRYHSFYVFLLDEFWKRDRLRTAASWRAFFRPREYMYSVAAHLAGHASRWPEHVGMAGIVGAGTTVGLAAEAASSYAPMADYIKSSLGGYGLYYRSVMAELEVIYVGGPGYPTPVDVPSDRVGKHLAEAFRTAVRETTYYRQYFDADDAVVPREVLEEYADAACLCRLSAADAPDRAKLLDVFLRGGDERSATARRSTLRFVLDLADQTHGHALSQDAFRQLIYYRTADNGASYAPIDACADSAVAWRTYQLREYFNYALNSMWRAVCDFGYDHGGDVVPIDNRQLRGFVAASLDMDALADRHGVQPPGLGPDSELDAVLDWVDDVVRASTSSYRDGFDLTAPMHERSLMRAAMRDERDTIDGFTGMVALLLALFVRLRHVDGSEPQAMRLLSLGNDGRLPILGSDQAFMNRLREHLASRSTLAAYVQWLVDDHIILQHQVVASQKLPDDTYRFRQEARTLRFFQFENQIDQRNSRFDALSTTVAELGLCTRLDAPDHALLPDGLELLSRGDLG